MIFLEGLIEHTKQIWQAYINNGATVKPIQVKGDKVFFDYRYSDNDDWSQYKVKLEDIPDLKTGMIGRVRKTQKALELACEYICDNASSDKLHEYESSKGSNFIEFLIKDFMERANNEVKKGSDYELQRICNGKQKVKKK